MKDAYKCLMRELAEDEQWQGFINAAWVARQNFSLHRQAIKKAISIKEEIAQTAQELAKLLRKFSEIDVTPSPEFYSINALLWATENSVSPDKWRNYRQYLLGAEMAMPWAVAPPLVAILDAVASAASEPIPWRHSPHVAAALSKRQDNPKTNYLRAFACLLEENGFFHLTTPIKQAMAYTATVVLNDKNLAVTYDDVRKAIEVQVDDELGNSRKK